MTNPANTRGFFDIATDPVKTFSQRLGARLFLHGGIRPAERAFAAVATSPFRKGAEAEAPLPFSDLGFLARIGLATALPLPAGNRVAALIDIGTGKASGTPLPTFSASEQLIPELIRAGLLPQGCFDAASGRFTSPGRPAGAEPATAHFPRHRARRGSSRTRGRENASRQAPRGGTLQRSGCFRPASGRRR